MNSIYILQFPLYNAFYYILTDPSETFDIDSLTGLVRVQDSSHLDRRFASVFNLTVVLFLYCFKMCVAYVNTTFQVIVYDDFPVSTPDVVNPNATLSATITLQLLETADSFPPEITTQSSVSIYEGNGILKI